MLERVKYFWEKLAFITLVLIFLLFEVRLTIVLHEWIVVILFGLVDVYLALLIYKNTVKLKSMDKKKKR